MLQNPLDQSEGGVRTGDRYASANMGRDKVFAPVEFEKKKAETKKAGVREEVRR
jgi:hypothetical protein